MRWIALALLLSSCDIAAAASNSTSKVAGLEKRVAALEEKLSTAKAADFDRSTAFDNCVLKADIDYWAYVRLNGRKARVAENGDPIYKASMAVWSQAANDKRNAIDICKATWK